jgi:hypothetical protein
VIAGGVLFTGGVAVVKVASAPALVPVALTATIRKWYVVPGARPEAATDTAWSLLSAPAAASPAGAREP